MARCIAMLFAVCLLMPPPARAVDDGFLRDRKRTREQTKRSIANYPAASGSCKVGELAKLWVDNGTLVGEIEAEYPPPQQQKMRRLDVSDAPGVWTMTCWAQPAGMGAVTRRFAGLSCYNFDAPGPDDFWMVTLSIQDQPNGRVLNMTGQTLNNTVYFNEFADNVNLTITDLRRNVGRGIQSRGLGQFRQEHPEETRKYLLPMLAKFGAAGLLRPGATDVYRVFEQIPADPAIAGKLEPILEKLDSPDFLTREKGSQELAALGRGAVLAVLRMGDRPLSPEQRSRLDGFARSHSHWQVKEAQASRADMAFLVECLEDEDLAVRTAAKEAIETKAGRKIEFDLDQPAEKRAAAVETLRGELLKG